MPTERLSALDASFLAVESPSAHMHVGWAATFAPPADAPPPSFEVLFHHIAGRLGRAPRYRQRIAPDALGLSAPLWIDAEDFDPAEHIHRSAADRLEDLADAVLSEPLRRDRPLWEFWIAPDLADGRIGLVGKAHHCMVDGLAAVELGTLLLDFEPHPAADEPRRSGAPPRRRTRSSCSPAAPGIAPASSCRCCAPRSSSPARRSRCRPSACAPPARSPAPCCRSRRAARSTSPARPTATSPPHGGRSTSCARSRTSTA